jgi:hypothetical protein
LAVDDDARASAGADDDAKDDAGPLRSAIGGFRHGEAIGIVGDAHLAREPRFEVGFERPAEEPRRVGVLDQARRR